MDIVKILAICIIAALISIFLRQVRPDFGFLITAFTVITVTIILIGKIIEPINTLFDKLDSYGIELSYFKVALKALGIGYLTNFAANLCRDAGQSSIAATAETVGKCSIFILSLPLIINIIDLATGFIK